MSPGVPTKVIAACIGLSAFALALISGLAAGNPLHVIILRAVIVMFVCQAIGLLLGAAGEHVVSEGAAKYKMANPVAPASGVPVANPSSSAPFGSVALSAVENPGVVPVQRV